MVLIIFYSATGTFLNEYKITIFNQESATIIIGMVFSQIQHSLDHHDLLKALKFNNLTFFYILLPPILFAKAFKVSRIDLI